MSEHSALDPTELALLAKAGLPPGDIQAVEPLTGGISSVVIAVTGARRTVVLKRALAELRVGDGWQADTGRSLVEAAYADVLATFVPMNALKVLAIDESHAAFVMERAPTGAANWKSQMLAGQVNPAVGRQTGFIVGRVHSHANDEMIRKRFADRRWFETLRIEPYFIHLIERGGPRGPLREVVNLLRSPGSALVHGDLSPKNVLVAPDGRPLLLDHEVAHWGDPAFDIAFLLSHLAIKSVHRPADAKRLTATAAAFLAGYVTAAASDEERLDRAGLVAAALMLARVDGRSPAEYLTMSGRDLVRTIASRLLLSPVPADRLLPEVHHAYRRLTDGNP